MRGQTDEEVSDTEKLVSNGRITSLMIVDIILSIEDELGIQLNSQDITVEQFDTIDLMANTVSSPS